MKKSITFLSTSCLIASLLSGCSDSGNTREFYDAHIIRNGQSTACYYDGCFYDYSGDGSGIIEYDAKNKTVTRAVEVSKLDWSGGRVCFSVIPSGFIAISEQEAFAYNYDLLDSEDIAEGTPVYANVHYLNFKGEETAEQKVAKGKVNADLQAEYDRFLFNIDRGYIYASGNNNSTVVRIDPLTDKREELAEGELVGICKDGVVCYSESGFVMFDASDISKKQTMAVPENYTHGIELFPDGTMIYQTMDVDEAAGTSKITGLYYFKFGEQPKEIPQLSQLAEKIDRVMSLGGSWFYVMDNALYKMPREGGESVKVADNVTWESIRAYNDSYILFNKSDTSADIYDIAAGEAVHIGE